MGLKGAVAMFVVFILGAYFVTMALPQSITSSQVYYRIVVFLFLFGVMMGYARFGL